MVVKPLRIFSLVHIKNEHVYQVYVFPYDLMIFFFFFDMSIQEGRKKFELVTYA